LLEELQAEAEQKSYQTHMAKRAEIERSTGKPIRGRRPSPTAATHKSRHQINLSDPDSRLLKTKGGYVQGYNAQAVATEQQFVIAAEVTNNAHGCPAIRAAAQSGEEQSPDGRVSPAIRRLLFAALSSGTYDGAS